MSREFYYVCCVLSKEEHIAYWIRQAEDDWGAVEALSAIGKHTQALFWAHLVAEKYTKAIWIKHNQENIPPRTHNLAFLISRTPVETPQQMIEIMLIANKFNLEGRYPENVQKIEVLENRRYLEDTIGQVKLLITWLIQQLQ